MPGDSISSTQFNCTSKMSTSLCLTQSPPLTLWCPYTSYSTSLSFTGLKIYKNYLAVCLAHSKSKEMLAAVTIIILLGNTHAHIYPNLITGNVFSPGPPVKHTYPPETYFPNQFHPALANSFVLAFIHSFTNNFYF